MHYIYIFYSPSSDRFYAGYSNNYQRRLIEHNTNERITYTSKHRPWFLKVAFQCASETETMQIEKFMKNQKSRKLIGRLCDSTFILTGPLAQLVRVPVNQQI